MHLNKYCIEKGLYVPQLEMKKGILFFRPDPITVGINITVSYMHHIC